MAVSYCINSWQLFLYLEVCGGVPVDVIEHNTAGADQIQTSSARLPNQTTFNAKGSRIRNIL
jgi:hypothetical protein